MLGHLKSEYRTCGKPDCPCGRDRAKRHGPYWVLVWWEQGRKRRRHVPKDEVEALRALLEDERTARRVQREAEDEMRALRQKLSACAGRAPRPAPPSPSMPPPPIRAERDAPPTPPPSAAAVFGRLMAQVRQENPLCSESAEHRFLGGSHGAQGDTRE